MKIYTLFLFFFLTACHTASGQKVINPDFDKKIDNMIGYSVPIITVEEACSDTLRNFAFLDAREKEEYKVSHLPGAIHIGYDNFDISLVSGLSKNKEIIVYCSIGYRSDKIGDKLKKAGYTNVHNLYGSIFEWANRGFLIVDSNENPTSKVHTYNKKWSKWVDNPSIEKVW